MKHTYTLTQLQNAVNNSKSFAQVMKFLGLTPSGNAYSIIKRNIHSNNIDVSHFTGKGWTKGTKGKSKGPPKIPLNEILSGLHPQYQSYKLKLRLLEAGCFIPQCYSCFNTIWCDRPIPLQLEHKDGNRENNKLENLTLLCPNCHAMTETFAGKNKKNGRDGRTRTDTR